MLCFVVVTQSFIMNSHEVFIHIHQGCFAGTGAIVRLPQCQWSKPDGYGKISQCITTTKHSKAKTVCIFLGIYCMVKYIWVNITSGNGSLNDSQSLLKPILTYHQLCSVAFTWEQFHKRCSWTVTCVWDYTLKITATSLFDQWVNRLQIKP